MVGGLAFSQLMTLYLTQVCYVYMAKLQRAFLRKGVTEMEPQLAEI
jgi:hypothetical protein